MLAAVSNTKTLYAQEQTCAYAIYLKDKKHSHSITKPETFLSVRAIERRAKSGIAITEEDLPVSTTYIMQLKQFGLPVHGTSKWLNVVVVRALPSFDMQVIAALPFVKEVKKIYDPNMQTARKADKFGSETMQESFFDYGMSANQIQMVKGHLLHEMGFTGEGMVIAVIDAGFNNTHQVNGLSHLFTENRILGVKDFVNNDGSVYEDHPHGTYVLSVMAAKEPGQVVGTAPDASYWLLRSEDADTETIAEEYYWVMAAEFADSVGADVINSSLGYTTFDDPNDDHTYQDMDGNTTVITKGANAAAQKGILVVNSAGNSGNSSWYYIGAPADGHDVLAVGSVDGNGYVSSFSSRGPSSDGRVKPNVCAQGQGTILLYNNGFAGPSNGTSFSSPLLAGMAASLWQAFPDSSNFAIKKRIEASAHKYTSPDPHFGFGIPNFYRAYIELTGLPIKDFEKDSLFYAGPNPFTDETMAAFYSATAQQVTFQLADTKGNVIGTYTKNMTRGSVEFVRLNKSYQLYSQGLYILRINSGSAKYALKFVKN